MSLPWSEYEEFLKQDLPPIRKRETTIFDIAGFPHYENVMSSCYAYFLNQHAGHDLAGVFLDSLLRLVAQRTNRQLSLDTWTVDTEVTTASQKRIDLLVTGTDGDDGKYIIIENKIYHWLHNDLADYWNYCEGKDDNKVGIVLSLTKVRIPENASACFVNILHSEWIEAVRASSRIPNLETKLQVYVNDFFTALENLKTDSIMDDRTRFFFKNVEKVSELVETQDAAWRYIIQQLRVAAEELDLEFTGSSDNYRYFEVPGFIGSGIYYTVMFDELLKKQLTMRVVIELQNKQFERLADFDATVKTQVAKKGLLFKVKQHGSWLHYVGQDYTFSTTELESLGKTLADRIRKDLEPIMTTMLNLLPKPSAE